MRPYEHPLEPLDLVGARLAMLETIRNGDWEAIPLDGKAARILAVEVETGTAWIVTVEQATIDAT